MTPSGHIAIMLNAGSGAGTAEAAKAELTALFSSADREVTIALNTTGDELEAALRAAIEAGASMIVAGGGDGTVNAVANAIAGREITLGVLPLGTLNHFARDLGIPLDLNAAAQVLLTGRTIRVDVGEVNGTVFLNNSSVGLYPRMVQLRERYRTVGVAKWVVAAWATLRVMRNAKAQRVELTIDGRRQDHTTPLVFIGNNEYRMDGFDAGTRASLTGGTLAIYVVEADRRSALLRLVWRILTGTARASGELLALRGGEVQVDGPGDTSGISVPVAVDGEVGALSLPLQYRVRPLAMAVCVP